MCDLLYILQYSPGNGTEHATLVTVDFTPSHQGTHSHISSILHHGDHMPFLHHYLNTNKQKRFKIAFGWFHSAPSARYSEKSTESGISFVLTGLIVLGLSLSLGRGWSFPADSGELVGDEDLLRWTVVLCFICAPDDVLWLQLPGKNHKISTKKEVKTTELTPYSSV